jgi:asparagine synthase (glutamine-hydrolysing)
LPQPRLAASPLRPIEVAYGLALGRHKNYETLAPLDGVTPRVAFERVLLTALQRSPCVISFSGGRDSSAILALAVHVARREGLPLPIPATLQFPGSAAADEREWQTVVLDRLGIDEWVQLAFTDELDAVGPVAQEVLQTHGLVWPFNLHFHLPIIKAAAGGALVTGFAGDEVARSSTAVHAARIIKSGRVTRPRDAAYLAYRGLPSQVRYVTELARGRDAAAATWLTARGRLELRSALSADLVARQATWGRLLRRWMWRARYYRLVVENFALMGRPHDVTVHHPFADPLVLRSFAAGEGRFAGLEGREQILRMLAGDLLPDEIIQRRSKGGYTDPLWTDTAKRFAREWSGRGLDERLVRPEAVRAAWLKEDRTLLATTLLQAAWLTDHGASPAAPQIAEGSARR